MIYFGIFILIIFGSHAILEYLSGGYHADNDCEFHRSHNRHYWFNNDDLSDN